MFKRITKLMNDSKGATAIEYGLIAALIAVAAIGAMKGIGTKLGTTLNKVSNELYATILTGWGRGRRKPPPLCFVPVVRRFSLTPENPAN